MTKKRLFFIGIAGLILVFLWPLLNNFIPLIKEWTNAKHDQAFLREVFKQANFQNALILLSLMILSSAIPGVSSSIFCIFVGLLYGPLLAIPMNIIGNTFGNLTSFEILRRLEKPEKSKRMEKLLTYIENFKHRFIGISLAFSIPFIPSALVIMLVFKSIYPQGRGFWRHLSEWRQYRLFMQLVEICCLMSVRFEYH